jgi:hypothetical protein
VDTWIWKLFFGGPGVEPAPLAAAILLLSWAACFAAIVLSLRRLVRKAS